MKRLQPKKSVSLDSLRESLGHQMPVRLREIEAAVICAECGFARAADSKLRFIRSRSKDKQIVCEVCFEKPVVNFADWEFVESEK